MHGAWYPILKMEWIDGISLDQFVDRHIDNPDILNALADRFRILTLALIRNGLAHGDLQHGNILIVPNGIKMVDYDGMYAPEFKGSKANELGHANYQHPLRTADHFGPFLDNFSTWVIYTSLLSLAIDSSLWKQLNGGDECLLFRRADFANPYTSYTFSLLEYHRSPRIRHMAKTLRSLLRMRPEEIPSLSQQMAPYEDMPVLPEPALLAGTRMVVGKWSDADAPEAAKSEWPKIEYFQQAVQQPSNCFKDRELRRAQYTFESDFGRLGFVCHLKTTQRQIAVKCFLKDQADREIRYYEVKRTILTGPAKQYFVDFEYQRDGIHSRGTWYPILKMEWITGSTLDKYVLDKLAAGDKQAVDSVLYKFRTMMRTLYQAGIAHGDIEPRNIIVTLAGLKLVDYDNIYVPSLAGLQSSEFGEPLYQHPSRSLRNFGPYLDHYPAWIIDNALSFLCVYPNTFHWGWDYIVQLTRTDELYYANSITNKGVEPIVTLPVVPEIRKRAHLMYMLQQFPVEQVPPIVDDFGSNLLKREALMSSINRVLQRYTNP